MHKLRWLERSVQKLTAAATEPLAELVRDWVVGTVVAGSVVLSAVARALHADRRGFEAALERISRGLGKKNVAGIARVGQAYLRRACRWVRPGAFDVVAIDLSDILKPYGRKMPFLCEVRDGSKSSKDKPVTGQGWQTVEIVAVDARHRVLALHRHAFSTVHPDYKSETNEVRKALERVCRWLDRHVWAVLDRGFDGAIEMAMLGEFFAHWCVRQRGDRRVFLPGSEQPVRMSRVATWLRLDERVELTHVRDGKLVRTEERFGFCTLEVPDKACGSSRRKPACTLRTLIVVHRQALLQPPMMLLVNRPVHPVAEARRWVKAYLRRWGVEEQTRAGKQSAELEDVRVLRWDALQNVLTLSVLTEGLLALQQVEAPRRAARLARLAPIDGPVPPFALYRIWMTVAMMLRGSVPALP